MRSTTFRILTAQGVKYYVTWRNEIQMDKDAGRSSDAKVRRYYQARMQAALAIVPRVD